MHWRYCSLALSHRYVAQGVLTGAAYVACQMSECWGRVRKVKGWSQKLKTLRSVIIIITIITKGTQECPQYQWVDRHLDTCILVIHHHHVPPKNKKDKTKSIENGMYNKTDWVFICRLLLLPWSWLHGNDELCGSSKSSRYRASNAAQSQ